MRSGVHDNCVFLGIQQSSMSSTENLYVFYKLLYLNVVNQNTSGDFFIFANCPKRRFICIFQYRYALQSALSYTYPVWHEKKDLILSF